MREEQNKVGQKIIDDFIENKLPVKQLAQKYGYSKSYTNSILNGSRCKLCVRPNNMKKLLQQNKQIVSAKIDQETAQQIINEFCSGSSTYELADKFGLWQTSICNLVSGRAWKQCFRPNNIQEIIKSRNEKGWLKNNHNDYLHKQYPQLTEEQNEILIGSLLGDGTIKLGSLNCSFVKKQCKKYKVYVDWHLDKLSLYSSKIHEIHSDDKLICQNGIIEHIKTENRLIGYRFYTHQHPVFTKFRNKWYPEGNKIIPTDLKLTPLSIAIWFCDDGNNSFNNREAQIATQSFTFDEADFLCELIKEFNIQPSIMTKISAKTGRKQPILKCNSKSYDNLIELIKPYVIWDCMSHKIKWRPAMEQWQISGKLTEDDVLQIFKLSEIHKQHKIANIFNVHKNTISSLLRGDSWKHLQHLNTYIPKSIRSNK